VRGEGKKPCGKRFISTRDDGDVSASTYEWGRHVAKLGRNCRASAAKKKGGGLKKRRTRHALIKLGISRKGAAGPVVKVE